MALGVSLRDRFPVLSRTVGDGKRLVYLDNAATTQKPVEVIHAVSGFYQESNANVHRGLHTLSEEATTLYEGARKSLGFWVGVDETEVIFVRGATEGINLVAQAWGGENLGRGDRVLVTVGEHHSNLVPWQMACKRAGADLILLPLGEDDLIDKEALARELERGAKVVAFTAQGNVLGAPEDVSGVCQMARTAGALSVVDAAQAAAHRRIDRDEWGCDVLALSGHKMMGPMGIGALVGTKTFLEGTPPWMGGGEMILDVRDRDADWAPIPAKFEAGTMNVAGAVGFHAALDVMRALLDEGMEDHISGMTRLAVDGLKARDGVHLLAKGEPHGVVSFWVEAAHPHDLSHLMDQEGVAVRAGHHCAKPLHRRLGIQSSLRASFYGYNDEDDVEVFLGALDRARAYLL